MRCFIGVPVMAGLADDCEALARGLSDPHHRNNFHMTLAFLGTVRAPQLDSVQRVLGEIAPRHAPFSVLFDRCEPFPGKNGPFVALTALPSRPLSALYLQLNAALVEAGFVLDSRPFRPHVTLAKPGQALPVIRGCWSLWADAIWLYQSLRDSNGRPNYQPLSRFPLSGP